ncbi:MAG: nucleoside kinase [Candidatus Marinimicrobia bacterium]|nr:nucleoside kinase [Candidatus Neomarinimicrobiota bacterium]
MIPPDHQSHHPSAVHASLGFLLAAAVEALFPERDFYIEHSFIGGYYCHFGADKPVTAGELQRLTGQISAYVAGDTPLELIELDRFTLQKRFEEQHRGDKLEILQRLGGTVVPATRFGHYLDYRFEPMTADLSRLQNFSLDLYDRGFVLRFPSPLPPYEVPPFTDSPKLYQVIQQRERWGRVLHVKNLGQLNDRLQAGQSQELIWVAEALHEKTLARIADDICEHLPSKRVVFVSGPSSSGKTTTTKRLAIQLKVNGYSTLALSMDHYFVDQTVMPPEPDGTLDFEALSAVDIPGLISAIQALLKGESIPRRQFSFRRGQGRDTDERLRLQPGAVLIVEGIHGLNPIFPRELGAESIQRLYVSAITQLNVDNQHRISSSDSRLIRRLVRDAQFRGYSAEETLLRWPAVRRGEERHIFAYQEQADHMFNSALVYELGALRGRAVKVLKAVPSTSETYAEARRLLTFLSFVTGIDEDPIPRTSILREFLGGSAFEY